MSEAEREEAGLPEPAGLEVPLRYAPTRLLLSGWIRSPEVVEGHAAWVVARHGAVACTSSASGPSTAAGRKGPSASCTARSS